MENWNNLLKVAIKVGKSNSRKELVLGILGVIIVLPAFAIAAILCKINDIIGMIEAVALALVVYIMISVYNIPTPSFYSFIELIAHDELNDYYDEVLKTYE